MTRRAIIDGSLVDVRNVNQHKCVRLVVDVPAERAREVIDAFGWPTMVNPVPVAIARLTEQASQAPRPAEQPTKPAGAPKSYAQRVALLCKEPRFWRFLSDEHGSVVGPVKSEADAAEAMRIICGVKSRSEIVEGTGAAATAKLIVGDYDVWLRVVS